jgi:hypothetical protein
MDLLTLAPRGRDLSPAEVPVVERGVQEDYGVSDF